MQFVKTAFTMSIRSSDSDNTIKFGYNLPLTCTVKGRVYSNITWICPDCDVDKFSASQSSESQFSAEDGYTSVLTVTEPQMYTCRADNINTSTISVTNTTKCYIADLPERINGTFDLASSILVSLYKLDKLHLVIP